MTATVDDRPRVLLKIEEKESGDLTVLIRGMGKGRALNNHIHEASPDPLHGQLVKEYRISVHRSLKSSLGVNVMKMTRRYEGGEKFTSEFATYAIKRDNGFAPLLSGRMNCMSDREHDLKSDNSRLYKTGQYDLGFSLIYSLFVGPPDREFRMPPAPDFQVLQMKFEHFRLVLLYSYLSIPCLMGSGSTEFNNPSTVKGLTGLSPGHDEIGCLIMFYDDRSILHERYMYLARRIAEDRDVDSPFLPLLPYSRFFKYGNSSWVEVGNWIHAAENTRWPWPRLPWMSAPPRRPPGAAHRENR